MELSEQFGPRKTAFKYKGVAISDQGRQTGRKDLPNYSFEYRWNAPVGQAIGAKITKDTPRKWSTATEEGPLNQVKRKINDYLAQGYSVHETGHLRAPGHPE
jgi:hypothetical protein